MPEVLPARAAWRPGGPAALSTLANSVSTKVQRLSGTPASSVTNPSGSGFSLPFGARRIGSRTCQMMPSPETSPPETHPACQSGAAWRRRSRACAGDDALARRGVSHRQRPQARRVLIGADADPVGRAGGVADQGEEVKEQRRRVRLRMWADELEELAGEPVLRVRAQRVRPRRFTRARMVEETEETLCHPPGSEVSSVLSTFPRSPFPVGSTSTVASSSSVCTSARLMRPPAPWPR